MSTTKRPIAGRASRATPCPVCESPSKGCSWTDALHFCRGQYDSSEWKLVKRGDDFNTLCRITDNHHERNGFHKPAVDWQAEAAKHARNLTAKARLELAKHLGLPLESLAVFPLLGWAPGHRVNSAPPGEPPSWTSAPCWTFPERDHRGRVRGISRRFRDPVSISGGDPTTKAMMPGGTHGLYIAEGWRERPGPVLVPEGASDVLALTAAGLSAVGRPSNTGGADLLAELFKDLPADRPIVLLAENDAKPDGKWPGKQGAERVAEALKAKLNRPARIVFPPAELKDARAWVHELVAGFGETEDWPAIGRTIIRHIENATRPAFPWSPPKYVSELSANRAGVEWLWEGCIARGHRSLFSALMKSGKTTLLAHMLRGLEHGGEFLGRSIQRCRTLVVSEESETIWAERRERLSLGDSLSVLSQPTLAKLSYAEWIEFIEFIHFHATDRKTDLIILDVLGSFAPWRNENDASEVLAAMTPLNRLTKSGMAVMPVHHHGKNDSGEGKAARGSTALAGAVDILLELRRYKPEDRNDRRRVLSGLGRFDEVPDELVIALESDGSGYTAEGDKKCVAARELAGLILEHLPRVPPGVTAEDLHAELPDDRRPSRGTLGNALRIGATAGQWSISGTGKRNDPRRFWKD